MIVNKLFRGSIGQSIVELSLIIIGVLIALWVDEWRLGVQEKEQLRQHLVSVAQEVDRNRRTLVIIRDFALPVELEALEEIIAVLDQPVPQVDDPEKLIRSLLASTSDTAPWLSQSSFDSLRNSESFYSSQIQRLSQRIAATYAAPIVLFERPFSDEGGYSRIVNELIPATYQSEHNPMRQYLPPSNALEAPAINDKQSLDNAIAAVVAEKSSLVRLARFKASRVTAKWYALTRIMYEFQGLDDLIVQHPLLRGVEIPEPRFAPDLELKRIEF